MAKNGNSGNEESVISASELGIDPEELWQAADKLRGSIDAAEYKHVVLGLIFLKYISDAFEARRAKLAEELKAEGIEGEQAEKLLESRDEYTAENVFWVPPEARRNKIQAQDTTIFFQKFTTVCKRQKVPVWRRIISLLIWPEDCWKPSLRLASQIMRGIKTKVAAY